VFFQNFPGPLSPSPKIFSLQINNFKRRYITLLINKKYLPTTTIFIYLATYIDPYLLVLLNSHPCWFCSQVLGWVNMNQKPGHGGLPNTSLLLVKICTHQHHIHKLLVHGSSRTDMAKSQRDSVDIITLMTPEIDEMLCCCLPTEGASHKGSPIFINSYKNLRQNENHRHRFFIRKSLRLSTR
jgi:hypothetical protein